MGFSNEDLPLRRACRCNGGFSKVGMFIARVLQGFATLEDNESCSCIVLGGVMLRVLGGS